MRQAPLRHDRAAARDDAGDAVGGEVDVGQAHAGVDGEIVDALFALLDQRVLVELPGQLDRIAFALLQRLVDRHGADRHRRVAQDPFAGGVDVAAGREVHHGVGAPADRPHHLVDFFLDRRGHGGVADIGVDLGQEVAADDHRLEFGVVDVAGDDGAAARDLGADEFRRDEGGHRGAKAFAVGKRCFGALELLLAAEVFALGDVDHLLGDDAGAGEFELRDLVAVEAAQRLVMRGEGFCGMRGADIAVVFRLDLAALIFLDAAALLDPGDAVARQAGIDVDGDGRDRCRGRRCRRPAGSARRRLRERMISRSGTRTSGASSGVTKIFREEGSGPVVTAGRVVSGLERMFMVYPPF